MFRLVDRRLCGAHTAPAVRRGRIRRACVAIAVVVAGGAGLLPQSAFAPVTRVTLELEVSGSGAITRLPLGVNPDTGLAAPNEPCRNYPAGSSQGGRTGICTVSYLVGERVRLTATGDAGLGVTSWSRFECAGASTCVVTMRADQEATASFGGARLDVRVLGDGTVSINPPGIDCPPTCTVYFRRNVEVVVAVLGSAPPSGWAGSCGSAPPAPLSCRIALTDNRLIGVAFPPNLIAFTSPVLIPLDASLEVAIGGTGRGAVDRQQGNVNRGGCTSTCTQRFELKPEDGLQLSATHANGSAWQGWRGGCGMNRTCRVQLGATHSVGACFGRSGGPSRSTTAVKVRKNPRRVVITLNLPASVTVVQARLTSRGNTVAALEGRKKQIVLRIPKGWQAGRGQLRTQTSDEVRCTIGDSRKMITIPTRR